MSRRRSSLVGVNLKLPHYPEKNHGLYHWFCFYNWTKVTQRQQQQKILLQQQQIQIKQADSTPIVSKVVRLNGIIQDTSVPPPSPAADGNHLTLGLTKGKKEPPQPPTSTATTVGNLHRPKTPKLDGEDSDSMASTSCAATGIIFDCGHGHLLPRGKNIGNGNFLLGFLSLWIWNRHDFSKASLDIYITLFEGFMEDTMDVT